jgi:multiple sugar transport system permease protein
MIIVSVMMMSVVRSAEASGGIEQHGSQTLIRITTPIPDFSTPDDPVNAANLAVVKLFVKRYPEIFAQKYRERYLADPDRYGRYDWDHVNVSVEPFAPLYIEGMETDLLAIAGDMAPEVLYVNFRKSDNYIRNGFLYPLDKPADGYLTGMTQSEINDRINPRLWEVIDRKGPNGEKHVWALPYGGMLGKVLAYRRDLFDKNHLAFPTEFWTWDDFLSAAKKLTDPTRGIYGTSLGTGKIESWYWLTFLWSAGGEVMVNDPVHDSWRCTFDTPEAVTALDFYTRLASERWVDREGLVRRGYAYRENEEIAKWQRGEIAMLFTDLDEKMLSTFNPDLVGIVPVPLGPTGKRGAEINSRMLGLFSGIKSPAVRDAAWEFIRFFDSEEASEVRTKVMVAQGLGQFVQPKYLQKFGYSEIERLAPPGIARTHELAIATGHPEPYGQNSNFAYELMSAPLQRAQELSVADELPSDSLQRRAVFAHLLHDANSQANELMMGIVSPGERHRRRMIAAVVLSLMLAAFCCVFWNISTVFQSPLVSSTGPKTSTRRRTFWAYVLLIPALLTIVLWQYLPLAMGSAMAFENYKLLGASTWVGLDHFGDLIVSSSWWQVVFNSLRYSILVIALTFIPPIGLAILLQEIPRGKMLFRMVFYLPAVVTGMVVTLLWKQFYDPSDTGMLNAIVMRIPAGAYIMLGAALALAAIAFGARMWKHDMRLPSVVLFLVGGAFMATGVALALPILAPGREPLLNALSQLPKRLLQTSNEPRRWLLDPETAMLACVLPMVWAGVGPGCLIYLAALKGIPDDYYEAADLDGANFLDKILFVVFPMLKPLIVIQFVGAFVGSFYGASANILAMTGGGANTEVADLHIWYRAFTFLDFGSATAMAWMLGSLLIGFTIYQLRILSRMEFRTSSGPTEK